MTQQNAKFSSANSPNQFSVSPRGEKFTIPQRQDYSSKFQCLEKLGRSVRQQCKKIVAAMGVGLFGGVMAAIIADIEDDSNRPSKFVIRCQRPSTRGYWKILLLNRGKSIVKAEDPEVGERMARCVGRRFRRSV